MPGSRSDDGGADGGTRSRRKRSFNWPGICIDRPGYGNQNTRLVFPEGYPSGQREQTVNLPAYAFDGSNPSPTTISFAIVFVNARGLVERGTQIDRAVISPQNNSSKARGQPSARFNRHDVIH